MITRRELLIGAATIPAVMALPKLPAAAPLIPPVRAKNIWHIVSAKSSEPVTLIVEGFRTVDGVTLPATEEIEINGETPIQINAMEDVRFHLHETAPKPEGEIVTFGFDVVLQETT